MNTTLNLCLGTVQLGMKYGIHGSDITETQEVNMILQHSYNSGILFYDTASSYGKSEELLGKFFKNKQKPHIITKIRPSEKELCNFEELTKYFLSEIDKSKKKLGNKKIFGCLLHDPDMINSNIAIKALNELKRLNHVEKIGISIYSPKELKKAINFSEIDIIQLPYNVFDHRMDKENLLKNAKEKNKLIFVRSILLQGLVTLDEKQIELKFKRFIPYSRKYEKICNKYGLSKLQGAILFIKYNENIDYLIFGVDNYKQLKEFISIFEYSLKFKNKKFIDEIKKELGNISDEYIDPRKWRL